MAVSLAPKELWQTTYDWLKATGNKPNKTYCRQEITTHADYPALTAVADFLSSGAMEYTAAEADASYIHQFNYPVLAHIKQPGQEYMHIISSAADWETQKEITKHWSGVVLFADNGAKWRNAENDRFEKELVNQKFYLGAIFTLFMALYIWAAWDTTWYMVLFGLFSMAGLLISILITASELGVQNSIVKQVCGAVSKAGCDAVLKTKYAKGFAGFSTGDIATIYFGVQFIGFLAGGFIPSILNLLLWVSLPGIVVAAWSIYTQAVVIKQWCALCLGIVGLLVLQCVLAAISLSAEAALLPAWQPLVAFALIAAILVLALWPVKAMLKKQHIQAQQVAELKKWKTDAGLFKNQWEKEQQVDTTIWENDLVIGNPNAPVMITVACNPYCGPCASAHKQLDKMLEMHKGKLALQIRLLCNAANTEDKRTIAVTALLQKTAELKNEKETANMLSDWFEWMNYEKWVQQWKPVTETDVMMELKLHEEWIKQSKIAFTPTFFVNGKKLPGRYGLAELENLLPQITEELTGGYKISS